MKIHIKERLRPFSHRPGVKVFLPGSSVRVEVYPVKILFPDRGEELLLPLTGPVADFTVLLDLERCRVTVWGRAEEGYFRYHLFASKQGVGWRLEKGPEQMKVCFPRPQEPVGNGLLQERLSLGCHKKQEWELIMRRQDLREILPHWLRLGTLTPTESPRCPLALEDVEAALRGRDGVAMSRALKRAFQAGFDSVLAPRTEDCGWQGLFPETLAFDASALLSVGARFIRSAFLQVGDELDILPALPPECFCGRFLDVACPIIGRVSLEWSKKQVRRMLLACDRQGSVRLRFPSRLRRFRLRRHRRDRGIWLRTSDSIQMEEGALYWLDRFEQ